MNKNISYKDIIDKNGFIITNFLGTSMYPLLVEKVDTVKLVKITKPLKKYDVILYRRDNKYILHRIVKVKKNCYYLCGDNQTVVEKNVTDDMIIAIMDGFYKGEVYHSIDEVKYIRYYKKIVRNRVYRRIKQLVKKTINSVFKKK